MTLTDPAPRPDAPDSLRHWPGLDLVPSGPRAVVSAAIAKRLFTMATHRVGVRVIDPGAAVPTGVAVVVLFRPEEFFARVGTSGLIGFGESYLTGAWDSPDLDLVLTVLARDIATLVPAGLQRLRRTYVARHPRWHRNSPDNTRNNIAHHYDLSNDLFRAFLDETMSYSSALFDTGIVDRGGGRSVAGPPGVPDRSELAAAQGNKIDRLLDLTGVGAGTDVLEFGTGWGELAIRAARRGARVRSITLSGEQRALAVDRVGRAGLRDRVSVDLLDYRQVEGTYDVVLSVEMIEAVGHEFLPSYFSMIDRALRPGGRAGIQVITMSDERVRATLGTYTWINKYIFPGGFIPSARLIEDMLREHTTLVLRERMEFGSHYAQTLRLWDEGFMSTDTRALGFDPVFDRMWHFYLTYCRAGFAAGYLDVQQLLITR